MRSTRPAAESVVLPAVAGATALVLGLLYLERRSLWLDEAIDVALTERPWSEYIRVAFRQEGSQALYLVFLKPWVALTSTGEWFVRVPSVVFATAAAALLVVLGLRLFGSRLVAGGAGLLLATNSFAVAWSQQVRQYALAMLLAVLVTYLFVVALESEGWRWWLTYGVVAGITVYAHFFVALVLASHVPALAARANRSVLRRWAVAAAVGFIIALPALNFAFNHDTGQVAWIPPVDYDEVRQVVRSLASGSMLLVAVGFVGLLALVYAAASGRGEPWKPVLVASWLVVPLALTVAISYFKPMLVDRYLIVSVPALALASAFAASRLGRRGGAVALAALVLVSLSHVRDWYDAPILEDWRSAVQYAEERRQPDELLFAYPSWLNDPVSYYAALDPDTSETLTGNSAWVVTLGERGTELEEWAAESGYDVASHTDFAKVGVWQLQRQSGQ